VSVKLFRQSRRLHSQIASGGEGNRPLGLNTANVKVLTNHQRKKMEVMPVAGGYKGKGPPEECWGKKKKEKGFSQPGGTFQGGIKN